MTRLAWAAIALVAATACSSSSAPAADGGADGPPVACGTATCGGDEYCVQPMCAVDSGTPCTRPVPFCAHVPAACDAPSASCSCLGAPMNICMEIGTGTCGSIDHANRTVTCLVS